VISYNLKSFIKKDSNCDALQLEAARRDASRSIWALLTMSVMRRHKIQQLRNFRGPEMRPHTKFQ